MNPYFHRQYVELMCRVKALKQTAASESKHEPITPILKALLLIPVRQKPIFLKKHCCSFFKSLRLQDKYESVIFCCSFCVPLRLTDTGAIIVPTIRYRHGEAAFS